MKRIITKVGDARVVMGLLPCGMQVLLAKDVVHSDLSLQGMERLELAQSRMVDLQNTFRPESIAFGALEDALELVREARRMLTQSIL